MPKLQVPAMKGTIPRHSMYAIYAYIDPPNHANVGTYGIHGVPGIGIQRLSTWARQTGHDASTSSVTCSVAAYHIYQVHLYPALSGLLRRSPAPHDVLNKLLPSGSSSHRFSSPAPGFKQLFPSVTGSSGLVIFQPCSDSGRHRPAAWCSGCPGYHEVAGVDFSFRLFDAHSAFQRSALLQILLN